MPVDTHKLERSLRALTFGAIKQAHDSAEQSEVDRPAELDVQYQVPILGVAYARPFWAGVQLAFDVPFYNATDQRDSPFVEPLFTFGYVLTRGHVVVTAFVSAWHGSEQIGVTGANVSIAAFNPGGRAEKFDGHVHLNFQGFGARALEGEMEAPTAIDRLPGA